MANVNVTPLDASPLGGASNAGWSQGSVISAAKVAQNDTLTVGGAREIKAVLLQNDATGVLDVVTVAGNVLTLTGAGTGPVSGVFLWR
jgi:hypothetical protein